MIRYLLIALILVTIVLSGVGSSAWAASQVLWAPPNGTTYAFTFAPGTLSFVYWDLDRGGDILIHNTNTIANFAAVNVLGVGAYLAFQLDFIGFSGGRMVFNVYGVNFAGSFYLGQFLL